MLAPLTSGSFESVGDGVEDRCPHPDRATAIGSSASPRVRSLMGRSASVAELPGWACRLLESERIGHLGLLDDAGSPRVLPVVFAVSGHTLVTAVDHKPKRRPGDELARVKWLRARPRAALTIDHYDDDWSRLG